MIQEKINKQRTLFSKLNGENAKSSKLLRASMHSKDKKSPYVMHLEETAARFESTASSFTGKNSIIGQAFNGTRMMKENTVGTNNGVRKLKRKAVVN